MPREPQQFGTPRGPLGLRGPHAARVRTQAAYPPAFLRVGVTDQGGYLLDQSLTLTLNTFDFTLVSPAIVPTIGDRLFLQSPEWDGVVVKVSTRSVRTTTYVTVSASNEYDAVASQAPFGLSDNPDGVATFDYADLVISTARTDSGDETTGSCTVFQAGLLPGMTFQLTAANHGLTARDFTVQDFTVTWPSSDYPVTSITFGSAIVRMSVWVNSVGNTGEISGTRITNGSIETPKLDANVVVSNVVSTNNLVSIGSSGITLRDDAGTVSLSSGGFGATWRRFIQGGVYNGDFAASTPTSANNVNDATNALPYWSFTQVSGTAITAVSASDGSSASGRVLRFDMAAGAAADESYVEQIIPVNGTRNRQYAYYAQATFLTGSTVSAALMYLSVAYLTSAQAEISGTAVVSSRTTTGIGANTLVTLSVPGGATAGVPTNAAYMRVRVGYKRDVAPVGTTESVSLCEVALLSGASAVLVQEASLSSTIPSAYGPTELTQTGGVLGIVANQGGSSGSAPALQLVGSGTTPIVKLTANSGQPLLRFGGTSFPASPASGDSFYRTDLKEWCRYDGTRWIGELRVSNGTLEGIAASAVIVRLPVPTSYDLLVEYVDMTNLTLTTNNGTNYWSVVLFKADSSHATTQIRFQNTDADGTTNYATHRLTCGDVIAKTTYVDWYLQATKVGTPGNFYVYAAVTWRPIYT